jgi:hypothetical protein
VSLESEARKAAVEVATNAIDALVSAAEREQARQRVAGCTDMLFHERMVQTLPRWRWLARAHHRRRARKARAHCDALRSTGDPVACRMCAEAKQRGLT